jgi:hypothetical protein
MAASVIVADFEIEWISRLSSDRRVWSGTMRSAMPAFGDEVFRCFLSMHRALKVIHTRTVSLPAKIPGRS